MLLQYLAVFLFLILFRIDICVGKIVFEEYNNTSPASGCTAPGGQRGNCERLTKCKTLSQKMKHWDKLRSYSCGFVGIEPKVCCPSSPLQKMSHSHSTELQTVGTAEFLVVLETVSTTFLYGFSLPPKTNPSTVDETSDGKPIFLPDDCGSSISTNSRAIDGQESEKGSWPWMVVIFRVRKNGTINAKKYCGGALVTERHVIMAAHCAVKNFSNIPLNLKRIIVRVGAQNLSNDNDPGAMDVGVGAIRIHENYDFRTYKNDIAVLRLNQSVPFSNNIAPICLPYNSLRYEDLAGKTSTFTGYEKTSVGGINSKVLMEKSFAILDQKECGRTYKNIFPITNAYLCVGTQESSNSCQDDLGGLLVIPGKDNRYYLIGIVSFRIECALKGYPGLYTRVTEFLDWLTPKLAD